MGAFMGAAGIACCYLPQKNLILSIAIVIGVFSYIVNRLAVIELWDSTEAIYVDFQSGRCGILLSHAVLPALDLVAVYLAYWLTGDDGVPIVGYLQHVAVVMFCLAFLSRNYKVFWNFAASDDYYRLILSIAGAFLVSRLSDFALPQPQQGVRHFPAACAAIAFTLAARLLLHYCRNALVDRHGSSRLGGDTAPIRTVIIGVTPLTRLYRNSILSNLGNGSRELLIGIIALDRTYFHSYCFGMGVLGGLDDLEHILEKHPFNKAVIAVPPSHDDFDRLQAFCHSHGVELHMLLLTNETV